MAERSTEDIREIIQEGMQAFARWGIAKPIAIRTGGLQVDKTVYHVMQELGVPLASNIGVAISPPINSELHFSLAAILLQVSWKCRYFPTAIYHFDRKNI